jgi:hypothetical protein
VVVTGAPRKRVVPQGARGFESHPLRQHLQRHGSSPYLHERVALKTLQRFQTLRGGARAGPWTMEQDVGTRLQGDIGVIPCTHDHAAISSPSRCHSFCAAIPARSTVTSRFPRRVTRPSGRARGTPRRIPRRALGKYVTGGASSPRNVGAGPVRQVLVDHPAAGHKAIAGNLVRPRQLAADGART